MINTHGHKITGLKKAAGEAQGLKGYYSGEYVELFFDRATGEVWTKYQVCRGQNTWTEYASESIVKICNLSDPTTMQEIADLIDQRVYRQAP